VAAQVAVSLLRIVVLAILVAGLATYLYVYEVPQAEREAKKEKLVAVDKDAVTGITLTYPDREIELRKGEKGWRVARPVDAPADETVVKSLLGTIADAEVQKTLDEAPKDLSSFGLDPPTVKVALTVKEGTQPPVVSVGKNTTIGGKTYVRKGEEPKLYLTSSSIGFGLNKQVKDLRDKQLMAFKDDDVSRVEIKPADRPPVTIVRKEKDAWTVDPGDHPADPTEVRSYLSSLRSTRAVDFPDDAPSDLGKYGLAAPRLAITVTSGAKGSSETLLLGGETTAGTQKQVYAKRADLPPVYALGDWSYKTLDKSAAQLRDKTVLGFDPGRVGKAVLERKDGAVTMVRGEKGWQVEGADGKKAKESTIASFLDDVRELRGADIAAEPATDLGSFGLDAPDVRVALTGKDGAPIGTILAAKRGPKAYVMRAGTGTVFELRDYMYARLDKHRRDFVEDSNATSTTVAPRAANAPPPGAAEDLGGEDPGGDEGD
jgi:hypothetical protein